MKPRRKSFAIPLALALVLSVLTLALPVRGQQAYPVRPVKLVVPMSPGGFQDVLARHLAQVLGEAWNQPVVVENRPGAAAIIASEQVAKSAPDGYTLYLANDGPLVINPFLYRSLPYDPVKDFAPIALVATTTMVLVSSPARVKATNVRDFVAEAKRAERPLDFGSSGTGGPHHLFMESFMNVAGLKMNHVPYKGGNPSLQAVASGEVAVAFTGLAPSVQLAKAGKLNILGFGGAKRHSQYPDIPTIAEQGYPGFDAIAWVGLVAPRGTPQAIVNQVEADVLRALRDPAFLQKLRGAGGDPYPGTQVEFRELIRKDQRRYSELIRQAGVKAE